MLTVEEADTGNHDPHQSGGCKNPGDVAQVVDSAIGKCEVVCCNEISVPTVSALHRSSTYSPQCSLLLQVKTWLAVVAVVRRPTSEKEGKEEGEIGLRQQVLSRLSTAGLSVELAEGLAETRSVQSTRFESR